MAANTIPIFSRTPNIQWANSATTANATFQLNGGTAYLVFSADTNNGSYVQRIRFRPLGTNIATAARVWINNGQTTGTTANNTLWDEITLPITTVSQVAALANYELPLNFGLPAGYTIIVTLGTTVAAGWDITVIGGSF